MTVIRGGPISQAETLTMSGIKSDIIEDLIHDCNMVEEEIDIKIQTLDTYQQFEALLNPILCYIESSLTAKFSITRCPVSQMSAVRSCAVTRCAGCKTKHVIWEEPERMQLESAPDKRSGRELLWMPFA